MEDHIALRVLGPVQAGVADAQTPQQRLVLAILALRAGHVVPVHELIDAVWDDQPPSSARGSLQALITRLRQVMTSIPGSGLERCGDGYRLQIEPRQVDVHEFRSLTRAGRAAPGGPAAIDAFDRALRLWRGPALADVPVTATVEVIRSTLAEEHLSAAADRIGTLLACGREQEAAADLPPLLARHPLAERLAGMLMVALYRGGQRAGALRAFRDIRARLADELGVEPGPELQVLHQRILAGDADLATAVARLHLRAVASVTRIPAARRSRAAPPRPAAPAPATPSPAAAPSPAAPAPRRPAPRRPTTAPAPPGPGRWPAPRPRSRPMAFSRAWRRVSYRPRPHTSRVGPPNSRR
jgi:DNA-binding SARP family transcriptional activator